jgi:hypothetical protein
MRSPIEANRAARLSMRWAAAHPTMTVALLALGAGCRPQPAAMRNDRPLIVVVSGDTAGWIVPCGCTTNQSGGLPRRATYLAGLPVEAQVIVADAGGAPAGRSYYDLVKFEAILRGEMAMGIAAHNLGAAEIAIGPAHLRDLAQRLKFPFVSTNIVAGDGQPLAEPMRVIRNGSRSVAIFGVISPKFAAPDVRIGPPREAVLRALRQSELKTPAVIVLAYVPEEELQPLAESLPEADAIVGGPTGQTVSPRYCGPTLVLSATRQGKFLARLDAPSASASQRWSGSIVELTGQFADEKAQMENVAQFRKDLGRLDIAAKQTDFSPLSTRSTPPDYRIAGTASCGGCHKAECKIWESSAHARAWNSLVGHAAQTDPDCQRCHATGYGLPGGFESAARSISLVNVGCEDCHGPSQGHVHEPKVHTTYFAQAANRCAACHDRENSPRFEFTGYWEKIRHGKPRESEEQKP